MLLAYAQEEIVLDSITVIQREGIESNLKAIKPSTLDVSFSPEGLNLFEPFILNPPIYPTFNKNLDFSEHLNTFQVFSGINLNPVFGFSPFLTVGKVFNQAIYRVNDRFAFGGNSFGAQSVFDMPRLNSNMQNMNFKGASMFLQYKVSKNFKVKGRVSISNRSNPF